MKDKDFFLPADLEHIKKEKAKAQKLKKSAWWSQQVKKEKCCYCGKKTPQKDLTMEHLTPLVRGGRTIKTNVAPACKKCNFSKKHKTLVEIRLENLKKGSKLPF